MCFVIVANWDGFIDRESGMLGYTIFVGMTECEDLVHIHHDPEKHLFDKSQWTHSAMISPIPAPYTVLPGKQLLSVLYLTDVDKLLLYHLGLSYSQVKPNTIKLAFDASPLSTQH